MVFDTTGFAVWTTRHKKVIRNMDNGYLEDLNIKNQLSSTWDMFLEAMVD